MVLDEEQDQDHRSNAIGIKTSKKIKRKKVPQRGLGVAQLERLRLAEQQKTPAAAATSSSLLAQGLGLPPQSSAAIAMANESMARHKIDPSIILLKPPSLPSSTSPSIDFFISGSSSPSENSPISMAGNAGHGFFPLMWNPGAPPGSLADDAPAKMEDPTSLKWRAPCLAQRRPPLHQQKQPLPAKKSIPASSPAPGGVDPLQMEQHPSNQSYDVPSCWKEQAHEHEKIGSIKRPYPFQTDGIQNQTNYLSKIPATKTSDVKLEESAESCGNCFLKPESQSLGVRGGGCSSSLIKNTTSSSTRIEDRRNKENNHNNGQADGSFLTLGSISPQTSKPMLSSSSLNHSISVYMQRSLLRSQPRLMESSSSSSNAFLLQDKPIYSNLSSQEKPFYCFLPPAMDIHEKNCIEQKEETVVVADVDLNLKL